MSGHNPNPTVQPGGARPVCPARGRLALAHRRQVYSLTQLLAPGRGGASSQWCGFPVNEAEGAPFPLSAPPHRTLLSRPAVAAGGPIPAVITLLSSSSPAIKPPPVQGRVQSSRTRDPILNCQPRLPLWPLLPIHPAREPRRWGLSPGRDKGSCSGKHRLATKGALARWARLPPLWGVVNELEERQPFSNDTEDTPSGLWVFSADLPRGHFQWEGQEGNL